MSLLFIQCILPASAQVKLGCKTGAGLTHFYTGINGLKASPGSGWMFGGFMQNTRYQSLFFTRIEVAYMHGEGYLESVPASSKVTVGSFVLPLAIGCQPGKHWYALAGIQPSVLLKQQGTGVFGKLMTSDIALLAGVGYNINYHLGVELRAVNGLLPMLNQETTNASGQIIKQKGLYQQWLQLSLNYNFAIQELSSTRPVLRRK